MRRIRANHPICVGEGFYPARAAECCRLECTNANTHAPVGADASVRPAVGTCEHERTDANTQSVCRGRCPHRPAQRMTVFTKRCGKFVVAHRADRGVRPYRTLCVVAENACNFAIAYCRGERGIDPYGQFSYLPSVVQIFPCALRGRGKPRPCGTTGSAAKNRNS